MDLQLLQQIDTYFKHYQQECYLVGGSVRNLLLAQKQSDWDFVTTGDAHQLARGLADQIGGHYVKLHEKASRVVLKLSDTETVIDLAPMHQGKIEADLQDRDFTVNAMACTLPAVLEHLREQIPLSVIDPLHGAADLAARHLRAVNDSIFKVDPLRLLRAVRFQMRYQLTPDEQTIQMMRRDAELLPKVAPDRIREELYTILQPTGATDRLRLLDAYGLLSVLIPELDTARGMLQPGLHYWDVFDHSLETVAALEKLAELLEQSAHYTEQSSAPGDLTLLHDLLQDAEQEGLFHYETLTSPAMKLAALLHDIGKPPTFTQDEEGIIRFYGHPQAGIPLAEAITRRLHISTQDRRLVQQAVAHHMRPGQLSHEGASPRAIRRFFVDLGPMGINVLLISLADHLAMRGPAPLTDLWQHHLETVLLLLTRYIRERERILPPRILQPDELIRRLKLTPGPIIGQLLEYLDEAQTEGQVHSKDDALWLAKEWLQRRSMDSQE